VLCGAVTEATLAASIFVAAVAVWTTIALGSSLFGEDLQRAAASVLRALAIAGVLLALAPFISSTLALELAMVLGVHAIYPAIMHAPDLFRAA
jgi:hypothetical protein